MGIFKSASDKVKDKVEEQKFYWDVANDYSPEAEAKIAAWDAKQAEKGKRR